MPAPANAWRLISRDMLIVWCGIVLAILGWLASEYGTAIRPTGNGATAISGNLVVAVGLIVIAAGFTYVSRSVKNAFNPAIPNPQPEPGVGSSDRSK